MKLVKRIGVAAVLIAVLAAALYFGGWVLCALFTAGAVMAAYEMGSALAAGVYIRAAVFCGV